MQVLTAAILLLLCYMVLEPFWIRIRHVSVHSEEVPPGFRGYRVAFLSDIHFEGSFASRLRRVVKAINRIGPDAVLMGGDYVARGSGNLTQCFQILKGIRSQDGVFCALGNHDYHAGVQGVKAAIGESGFRLIDNQSFWIEREREQILVGGVGDWWEGHQLTDRILADASSKDFCILVSHNPDYFVEHPNVKIDLGLAGHTHGGQVTLFGKWAPFVKVKHTKYLHGMYRIGNERLYVSSGLGTTFPRVRLFCRPEIVIFELSN
jgi:predicted MPP superfamily phosphohydrolase